MTNLKTNFRWFVILTLWAELFMAIPLFSQTTQPDSQSEIRGVWLSPGFFGTEEKAAVVKIRTTLDEYQSAGINTLIPMIKSTAGFVYFKSKIAPADSAWNWDFFGTLLREAQQRQMVVHPWFCVFTEGGLVGQVRRHPEWLIRSRKGEMVAVVNPALPEVRRYEISLMIELLQNYPVDWLHLDYIRFPCEPTEVYFSYDTQTRALFKSFCGEDPLTWKSTDSGNLFWNVWLQWNADQVTQFIRELRKAVKGIDRPIRISAAVFPNADNAKVLIGQDWSRWAEEGLVDLLCPMLYTNACNFFTDYVRRAVVIAKGHCQMAAGIGIGTSHNQNTPEGMIEQVNLTRKLGADGFVFFSANSLKPEFLTKLLTAK